MRLALQRLRVSFGWPSLLLVSVAISHYGYDLIAGLYEPASQLRAGKAWHSVLRAVETMLLYGAVWWLMPWEPIARRLATVAVCSWGIIESAQIAVCRLQYPMDRPPPDTALYSGLCDLWLGSPVYILTLIAVMVVLSAVVGNTREKNDG